ncbi:MAG TPA: Fic family protein [Solirubrobacterales bacterium]|jgi:Fic family protein|nr:Fic family protein [Solirubrobacterales bacterium]
MRSFQDPERTFAGQPASLGVLLQRVDIGRGQEGLYENQLPQLLQRLAKQTKVESIKASNAIEGVEVDPDRAEALAGGNPPRFRNRSEKEFAGYADALDALMREPDLDPLTVPRLLEFHRKMLAHTDGRGGYLKQEDNKIANREPDGSTRIIFEPPSHTETEGLIGGLCASYEYSLENRVAHPLVLLSAFVLDLLAIHPFLDGNGRMSRLATTHELPRLGYGVARYVSVDQRIYDSKNSYYVALEHSQRKWHEAEHDIWPWTTYLITVLAESYDDFEGRVAAGRGSEVGTKQERVRHWILNEAPSSFRISDVRIAVPGVGDETIRLTLRKMKGEGLVEPTGTGRAARWRRIDQVQAPTGGQPPTERRGGPTRRPRQSLAG